MTDSESTIATLTAELAGARAEAIAHKRERDAIHSQRNAAVAAEREACARIAELTPEGIPAEVIAAAIRGRGT